MRLARAEHGAPAVASAFREGRITLLQAEVSAAGREARGPRDLALRVTLRRLEDEVLPRRVAFWAPPEVAALFEALVARVGLEAMLDHAIATWLEAGAQFEDYADFDAGRLPLHGSGLHGAAQSAEPSHLVPLGVRAGRGVESHDALCAITTIAGCTRGAWRFGGGRPMGWSTNSAWGGSGRGT